MDPLIAGELRARAWLVYKLIGGVLPSRNATTSQIIIDMDMLINMHKIAKNHHPNIKLLDTNLYINNHGFSQNTNKKTLKTP